MRCDWTGSQPVAFRVAAQIFTIRPKLNLIVCCLIFGLLIPSAKNMHRSSPTEPHTDRCWKDGHIYWPTISPFSLSTVVLWDGLSHSVKVIFKYILNHFIPAHFRSDYTKPLDGDHSVLNLEIHTISADRHMWKGPWANILGDQRNLT